MMRRASQHAPRQSPLGATAAALPAEAPAWGGAGVVPEINSATGGTASAQGGAASGRSRKGQSRGNGKGGAAGSDPGSLGELLSQDLTDALGVLDAHRLVHVGIRRCRCRVEELVQRGAVSGGDTVPDRILDRALHDRRILGGMRADLRVTLARLRERVRRSAAEQLVGPVPLATLQRDVLLDRIGGDSWPRIAARRTRGDRGSAVRAFRQAVAHVRATASVLEVLGAGDDTDDGEVAGRTGLTVRMVKRVRRHLKTYATAVGAASVRSEVLHRTVPTLRVMGQGQDGRSARGHDANRPNPGGPAEPCPAEGSAQGQAFGEWRVLQVRPGSELRVKVALERALGDQVRCRTLRPRPNSSWTIGYVAVATSTLRAVDDALRQMPDVVAWVGGGGRGPAGKDAVLTHTASRDAGDAAAWLDPRRGHP